MVIMLLFMLDKCCTSVVDGIEPALGHCPVVGRCVVYQCIGPHPGIKVLSAWLSRHSHPEVNIYHRDEKISLKLTNYI